MSTGRRRTVRIMDQRWAWLQMRLSLAVPWHVNVGVFVQSVQGEG